MKRESFLRFWAAVFFLTFSLSSICIADLIDNYPSSDEMYAEIRGLAAADPARIELIEYGRSVQDRPLLALRFHLGDGESRPGGLVAGNIHGEEWIGNRTAMAVARRIASGIESDPWIQDMLSRMDLYVAPCVNPDGYFRTWESHGRDKLGEMRKNANGVDLNRNFPPPNKEKIAARNKPKSTGYPGTEPLSEPETSSIVDLVVERNIIATVDYHSVMGVIITPSCGTKTCFKRFNKMTKAYSKNQKRVHYLRSTTPALFGKESTPGMMEPYLYNEYGVMSILVEAGIQSVNIIQNRSIRVFEIFNPKNPDKWADNDVEAALHALDEAWRLTGGKPVPEDER